MTKPHIGFLGIGVMGAPMASNLANAGYPMTLFDINPQQARLVGDAFDQVSVAETPRAVAEASDIVITMLPTGEHVRQVITGDEGLLKGYRSGATHLDTSSAEPWLTIETAAILKEKGVTLIDAPVSGAQPGAQAGELVFMVGGDKESVERVKPLFQVMGQQFFHLGPVGSGHSMKCINNLITAVSFMATAEGLIIGKQLGLDPNVMTDVLNMSTGMTWNSINHIKQRITSRKFDDAFKLELMVKDINIAMKLAEEQKIPLPLSALSQHLWKAADHAAGKGSSISNMVRWVEKMTGTELTAGSE